MDSPVFHNLSRYNIEHTKATEDKNMYKFHSAHKANITMVALLTVLSLTGLTACDNSKETPDTSKEITNTDSKITTAPTAVDTEIKTTETTPSAEQSVVIEDASEATNVEKINIEEINIEAINIEAKNPPESNQATFELDNLTELEKEALALADDVDETDENE